MAYVIVLIPKADSQSVKTTEADGPLLQLSRPLFPFIKHVWADGGYNHERVTAAINILVEIVRKQLDQVGFVVLPRRWVVERFFAWINRNRRLAKDCEATINSAAAFTLRRIRHAAHPTIGMVLMNFETDSEANSGACCVTPEVARHSLLRWLVENGDRRQYRNMRGLPAVFGGG